MKNTFLSLLFIAFVLVSCNQKNKSEEEKMAPIEKTDTSITVKDTTNADTSKQYACPMHPEVQGNLNDKCSKCGMDLTEEVK